MDEKTVKAVNKALDRGERIELSKTGDGSVSIKTVHRKNLKI